MQTLEKKIEENRQGEVLQLSEKLPQGSKKLYLESYGCQMNFSDSEIVASILSGVGFETTRQLEEAHLVLLNTCAIRDNAEQRIWSRLRELKSSKKKKPELIIGVLGCMAERLKTQLLEQEKLVDMVVGPDAYRDLPNLIESVENGQRAVNVLLSKEETYADISPVRLAENGISAFISIMRGCDNMCSFCVVPFTRGRERSRNPESIVAEATQLFENGYREITLLGQNVDSYLWAGGGPKKSFDKQLVDSALQHKLPPGEQLNFVTFADLLEKVAGISASLRIRFSTSNPRDLNDAVLYSMARHSNICKYIHLPVQSGSTRILEKMNRGYSREDYLDRINRIREIIPECGISSDIISGFCSETVTEHLETISLMQQAEFDYAFMFKYSERPGTQAERMFDDDVTEETKIKRLSEIIALQNKLSLASNQKDIGKTMRVLADSFSKKSNDFLSGRNDQNKVVIFPKMNFLPGDYVEVRIDSCTSATLKGTALADN